MLRIVWSKLLFVVLLAAVGGCGDGTADEGVKSDLAATAATSASAPAAASAPETGASSAAGSATGRVVEAAGGTTTEVSAPTPATAPPVTQPEGPRILSTMSPRDGGFYGVSAQGHMLYVAAGLDGFKIIDASDLSKPRIVATIGGPGASQYSTVRIDGALVANNTAVLVAGPVCYGTCSYDPLRPGILRIYDIADPANPALKGQIVGGGGDMVLAGNYLYALRAGVTFGTDEAAYSAALLDVIDLTDPSLPKLLTSVPVARAGQLIQRGKRIFLSHGSRDYAQDFQVIDISDPVAPVVVETTRRNWTPAGPVAIARSEGLMYRVNGNPWIQIVDVSRQFVELVSIPTPAPATSLFLDGETLYVTQGAQGVAAFDVADQKAPKLLHSIATPQPALRVAVFGDFGVVITEPVYKQICCGFFTTETPSQLHFFSTR